MGKIVTATLIPGMDYVGVGKKAIEKLKTEHKEMLDELKSDASQTRSTEGFNRSGT